MKNLSLALLTAFMIFGVGCSGSPDQVVTGRVAPGFPSQVSSVQVVHQGTVVASAPVASDGSFRLAFPPSSGLSLQVMGQGQSGVVFPRKAGAAVAFKATFSARAGSAPFDLGKVRYVGDASATPIVFHSGPAAETECDDDGHDANGATCVDDDDDEDDGTCEADDGDDGDDDDAGGTPPQPGTGTGSGPIAYAGDAVPEHNFPADGCNDDDGDDDDDDSGDDGDD